MYGTWLHSLVCDWSRGKEMIILNLKHFKFDHKTQMWLAFQDTIHPSGHSYMWPVTNITSQEEMEVYCQKVLLMVKYRYMMVTMAADS